MMRFGFVNDEKMSVDRVTEWFGYGAKRILRREWSQRIFKKKFDIFLVLCYNLDT